MHIGITCARIYLNNEHINSCNLISATRTRNRLLRPYDKSSIHTHVFINQSIVGISPIHSYVQYKHNTSPNICKNVLVIGFSLFLNHSTFPFKDLRGLKYAL